MNDSIKKSVNSTDNIQLKSKVAVVHCTDYDIERVYRCVKAGIDALGGIDSFVCPSEKILIKPNFLVPSDPAKAVITHPAVLEAVFRVLAEHHCKDVSCGDSPGHGSMENVLKMAGLGSVFDNYNIKLADMEHDVLTDYSEGFVARQFHFAKAAAEADAIISVSKMKTHALEHITGAVKNFYGTICGYNKAAGHVKFPSAVVFAGMLADIHRCLKPRLHIMDGITAMEGNGPGSGTPINMNVLLFSTDPVALDAVFCRLIDIAPEQIPTNLQGQRYGIGTYRHENIEIIDVSLSDDHSAYLNDDLNDISYSYESISFDELFKRYGNAHFDVDRNGYGDSLLSRISAFVTSIAKRPYIDKELCVKCGICTEHCPVPGKAITFANSRNNPPVYDYKKCIRCYCCQEMCPKHAIKVRHNLL